MPRIRSHDNCDLVNTISADVKSCDRPQETSTENIAEEEPVQKIVSKNTPGGPRTDVMLAIQEPYMQQLVDGTKTYEFRKYLLQSSVKRIWFYRTAPYSSLDYVCEILPARTREVGDAPLTEDGIGKQEFNTGHQDWIGYDYAYKVTSVYRLVEPIPLQEPKDKHRITNAPRGMMYTPDTILQQVDWQVQDILR